MVPITGISKLSVFVKTLSPFLFAVFIIGIFISNLNKNGYLNDKTDKSKRQSGKNK